MNWIRCGRIWWLSVPFECNWDPVAWVLKDGVSGVEELSSISSGSHANNISLVGDPVGSKVGAFVSMTAAWQDLPMISDRALVRQEGCSTQDRLDKLMCQ